MPEQPISERPKPYIGISGVVKPIQQQYLVDKFVLCDLDQPPINRQIALGVKAVHKTQYLNVPNKYGPHWYPVGHKPFAGALEGSNYNGVEALRVAQMYFDPEYNAHPNYQQVFVDSVCRRGKAWLNAIQFDLLPWHIDETQLEFIERVKNKTGKTILLQAHGEAMSQLGPDGVVKRLGRYAGAIDYILFDASHGKGMRMDTNTLRPFLEAVYGSDELRKVGFSVAGGLNADVVKEALPSLLQDFPDISWDAEGQLHSIRNDGARPIDAMLAKRYLAASAEVLGRSVSN